MLFLTVTLVVITVRAAEKIIKKIYAYFLYIYNKKRGKEQKEETLSESIKELGELRGKVEQIEQQQKNNVDLFMGHEKGILDKLEQLSNNMGEFSNILKNVEGKCDKLGEKVDEQKQEMERTNKTNSKKEAAQRQNEITLIEGMNAAIALGEATARAVQRIPDAKCNGDMSAALEYATTIKHKHKQFITEQSVNALY